MGATLLGMDLVAFLRARLDEDEKTAGQLSSGPGYWPLADVRMVVKAFSAEGNFLATWSPARVLDEIEAKRQLVDEAAQLVNELQVEWFAGTVLRLLALPYAGHPDYREEWKSPCRTTQAPTS